MRPTTDLIDGIRELRDDMDRKWADAQKALTQKQSEIKALEKRMIGYEETMSLLLEAEKRLMEKGGDASNVHH